jgi:hypothetical protein
MQPALALLSGLSRQLDYTESNEWMNIELERIWKEAIVALSHVCVMARLNLGMCLD